MGRYVSEAWFGRQLARQPPAHGRVHNGSTRHAQPELARPAGMALIITETALLLGTGTGRASADELTIFESLGLAVEDQFEALNQQAAYAAAFLLALVAIVALVVMNLLRPKDEA